MQDLMKCVRRSLCCCSENVSEVQGLQHCDDTSINDILSSPLLETCAERTAAENSTAYLLRKEQSTEDKKFSVDSTVMILCGWKLYHTNQMTTEIKRYLFLYRTRMLGKK